MSLTCPLGISCIGPARKKFYWPYNKPFIDQAFSVMMAGYWLRSFLSFLFLRFIDFDFVSVHNVHLTPKRNSLANIKPSGPDAWSIKHIILHA